MRAPALLTLCLVLAGGLRADPGALLEELASGDDLVEVERLSLGFDLDEPPGLAVDGQRLFLVTRRARGATAGQALLQVADRSSGRQLHHAVLLDGPVTRVGGPTHDGRRLLVPVVGAGSETAVLEVDMKSFRVRTRFRFGDHLAALAVDPREGRLHAFAADGRGWYVLTPKGRVIERRVVPQRHYRVHAAAVLPGGDVVVSGAEAWTMVVGTHTREAALGGLGVLRPDGQLRASTPITKVTDGFLPVTRAGMAVEATDQGLVLHFAPEGGRAKVLSYVPRNAAPRRYQRRDP